jgi:hypothetical protein
MKIHRWQPTGFTPCGRPLESVVWNEDEMLQKGVTCLVCNCANTLSSLFPPRPHPIKEKPSVQAGG